jgi:hypothetical protein
MFSSPNTLVMISGVLLGMAFITWSIYFVNKLFINDTKDLLVRFILVVFGALVAVFIVDKVIAFGMPLLSVAQNENLFDLIKTLTLMIFSYYFGTQKADSKKD